jgi:citrate lyase subunit beta/citryl-CoA lyase
MLGKATRYPAHAFIPDLEDSVPASEREAARRAVSEAIPGLVSSGRPIIPRLNSLDSGLLEAEVEAIAGPGIAGVSVGKIRKPDDVRYVGDLLDEAEARSGITSGAIGILPWIESAAALSQVNEICRASRRVRWVAFGAEDLTVDMGVPRAADLASPDRSASSVAPELPVEPLVLHARATVAIAARAAGVIALDTPYVFHRDEIGLVREATLARRMGFGGKFAIHPSQVEPINRVFMPSASEIARARMVIQAWEKAAARGRGAISIDGEMIDVPVVARARRLLREAGVDAASLDDI